MAFRKKVKCTYRPYINAGGFVENKSVPVSRGDGTQYQVVTPVSASVLSKSALPLITLDEVIASGKPIEGHVSFEPSVHSVESNVASFLETHLPEVEVNSEE